jgi:hypothetical protein
MGQRSLEILFGQLEIWEQRPDRKSEKFYSGTFFSLTVGDEKLQYIFLLEKPRCPFL